MTSPLDLQLRATHDTFLSERPNGADEDVHMVASMVDHVIERCSAPGDLVFDPFAGFGTTLERAVALDRRAIGIELLPERVQLMQHRMPWPTRIIEGDARELRKLLHELTPPQRDGTVDLILASPPYMTAEYHEADPLMAYERDGGDYARYLSELGLVAAQCARMVKPGGFVVWNVADIHHRGSTTPLIQDCSRALEPHLTAVGVTEITWDRYPHDLVRDVLLVFQRAT